MTPTDPLALAERLKAAYAKVELWPERRMAESAVEDLGDGFLDLLALRNMVPEALARIAELEKERDEFFREYIAANAEANEEAVHIAIARAEAALARIAELVRERDEWRIKATAPKHHVDCEWHVDQYPWECTCGQTRAEAAERRMADETEACAKIALSMAPRGRDPWASIDLAHAIASAIRSRLTKGAESA